MSQDCHNHVKNTLRRWREKINCDSYRQWSQKSHVPELQFYRLENGLLEQTPLGVIRKIADSVGLPLDVAIRQLTQPQQGGDLSFGSLSAIPTRDFGHIRIPVITTAHLH